MQQLLIFWILFTALPAAMAQETDTTATSSWQRVRFRRSAVVQSSVSRLVTFTETFADNQNQWFTGQSGRFSYDLAPGSYAIRRVDKRNGKSGQTAIELPDSLDLNRASTFLIEVDMIIPKGSLPAAGLMMGVRDQANYTLFVLRGQNQFMLKRVVDGSASSAYLPGIYQPIEKGGRFESERNTLRVEKRDDTLFFAVNGQDLPGASVAFRPFSGNGIGFISSADEVHFQNLRITVGLP